MEQLGQQNFTVPDEENVLAAVIREKHSPDQSCKSTEMFRG